MKSAATQFKPEPRPEGADRRYHFDVTDIADFVRTTATLSGIQRVAFTVIKEMAISHGSNRVFLCMKDRRSGKYVSVSSDRLLEIKDFGPAAVRYALGMARSAEIGSAPTLEKYEGLPVKQAFRRLIGSMKAAQNDEAYFHRRGTSVGEWKAHWQSARSQHADDLKTSLPFEKRDFFEVVHPGDELVLLGALWDRNDLHDTFSSIKANGASITLMVYDLIPLTVPEASPDTHHRFLEWLESAVGYADRFLCISKNTAKDLSDFLDQYEETRPVTVVALAQQFTGPGVSPPELPKKSTRARISEVTALSPSVLAITTRPFVLCVGTMEIRKNNLGLVQAWSQLADDPDLDLPRLVFAGKKGWNNEPFFELLKASGNLEGWVQVVEGPSDQELEYLYRHCEFTAMVSFAEGWGLPIGESLSYGKTAVVADNTSMPEVGGDMVEYCDARSVKSIARACRNLVVDRSRRNELEDRIRMTRLRSWDDVLRDFIDAIEGNNSELNCD